MKIQMQFAYKLERTSSWKPGYIPY